MRVRRPTVVDVSREASVAVGTVSRFLNGHNVRRTTRARLEAAIRKLDFRVNPFAQAIKSSRTRTLGFVTPFFDGFNALIMTHLVQAFRELGYSILIFSHAFAEKGMQDALRSALDRRIDGLVFSGTGAVRDEIEVLCGSGVPVVLYNNDIPGLAVDKILVNDRAAMSDAVRRIVSRGHTRIGLAVGDLETQTAINRRDGYRDALAKAAIPLDPRLEFAGPWSRDTGREATRELTRLRDPATAILYSSDRIGRGALGYISEAGIRLGRDLSVVCFDDHEVFRVCPPGIAAVEQPVEAISGHVVEIMAARLGGDVRTAPRDVRLECRFHQRPSLRERP